jgi:hypothetical protein
MNKADVCVDIMVHGQCFKGADCLSCNKQILNDKKKLEFNLEAKEFVPKKKIKKEEKEKENIIINNNDIKVDEIEKGTLKLNLEAPEYKPLNKNNFETNQTINYYKSSSCQDYKLEYNNLEDELNPNEDEIDMIANDIVQDEELSDEDYDDDKWIPKFKDCECCKGYIYKCKGTACQYLGACYCKVKYDCDEN